MKKRVTLINPNCNFAKGTNKATVEPPIGIAYLAAYLIKNAYETKLIDANILQLDYEQIGDLINPRTDIIGISFNIVSATHVPGLVMYLKNKFPEALFLAGGPYPSALPDLCLKEFGFDGVCIGEGEETLLEVANNVDKNRHPFEEVKGMCYRDNSKIIKNASRDLIPDLDSLPFPALELLPDLKLYKSRTRASPAGVILSSRGCPFGCVYCNKNIFRSNYRSRSVTNIISEIEYQIWRFGIKQVDFLDDNLTLDMKKGEELFDNIIRKRFNIYINMQNGVRADRVNEGLIKKMKEAGVFKVSIGVESGDPRVQKLIRKNLNLNKVLEATRLFKKYGIGVYGNFMFGLPGDNSESMQKTIDFAKKMNPDIANFMVTIPLPGTELYEEVKSKGALFIEIDKGMTQGFYGGKVYYSLTGIETDKVIAYYKKAYFSFYLRPRKIIELLFGCKNLGELKWLVSAAIDTLKPILRRKRKEG